MARKENAINISYCAQERDALGIRHKHKTLLFLEPILVVQNDHKRVSESPRFFKKLNMPHVHRIKPSAYGDDNGFFRLFCLFHVNSLCY